MEMTEKIFDFLDGTLSKEEELQFFSALAHDDELADTFHDILFLEKKFKYIAENTIPSTLVSQKVFSKLGYKTKFANTFKNPNGLVYASLSFGIIGILLSVFTFIYFNGNNNIKTHITNDNKYQENILTDSKSNGYQLTTPVNSAINNDSYSKFTNNVYTKHNNNSIYTKHEQKAILSEIKDTTNYQNDNLGYIDNIKHTSEINIETEFPITIYNSGINEIVYSPDNNKQFYVHNINLKNDESLSLNLINDTKFQIEIFRYEDKYNPAPTITPYKFAMLNKTGVFLNYALYDNFLLGVGIKQETFFTKYSGIKNDTNFIYEQQPNLLTAYFQTRYIFLETNYFNTYIDGAIGYNSVGLVLNASTGLNFPIVHQLNLQVGIGYSKLFFQHDNQVFNSSKYCLKYGLLYKF